MMMNYNNVPSAIVICHGKSEKELVDQVTRVLKDNIHVMAQKNGKISIQLDILPRYINSNLSSVKQVKSKFGGGSVSSDFQIFPIMDLDDCTDKSKKINYKKGNISDIGDVEKNVHSYMHPIYCEDNLEDVLKQIPMIGYVPANNKEKSKYGRIFRQYLTREDDIKNFSKQLKKTNNNNLAELIDHLIKHKNINSYKKDTQN